MTPARGSKIRSRGKNTMLIQICFMCVSLKFQSVRCKVNMSIAHLNFNFYPKKLILWQVMFILCSSPPATTLRFCYWQRYSSFLSDSIYEKWILGLNAAGHKVSFHFVEVNFAGVPNVDDRDRLYWIGTNFDLSDEDVDFLITSAHKALRQSADFQDFLAENRKIMERKRRGLCRIINYNSFREVFRTSNKE